MPHDMLTGVVYDAALLLALGTLYAVLNVRMPTQRLGYRLLVGGIIGLIGIGLMYRPWHLLPGIIFDVRSNLLGVSGLFFGGLPTGVAVLVTGLYRLWIGGPGVAMGVLQKPYTLGALRETLSGVPVP
jgi:hypothetical protein